jgi:hypothetical protein
MVGTIEQVIEVQREKKQLEEMTDWEMKGLPRGLRIDIPLASVVELRKVAPLLREFADILDRECRHNKVQAPSQILWHLWGVGRTLRARIEDACRTKAPARTNSHSPQ